MALVQARSFGDGPDAQPAAPGTAVAPRTAPELFQPTKVWSIELQLKPEAFAAMEPKGAGNMFSLMGAMAGGGGVGPADLLAAAMAKRGDRDGDGRVDRDEFAALAERWFALWDNTHAGRIDLDRIRGGLRATVDPEGTFENKFPVFLRGSAGKRNGLATALGIEFTYVTATMFFEGSTLENVGLRYKGNGTFLESRASLKRSLKVDLNHSAKGQKLAGLTTLNLHNNVTDASGMVEPISHSLYRDAGVPAPRTTYAQVFLTVPPKHDGTYLGLYSIVENVDKDFAADRFGSRKGAIFKPVTPNLFADIGETWQDFKQAYDPKTDVSEAQARRVIEFSKLTSHATDADLADRIGEFLDLDEFARFMAVTGYLASMDSILYVGQNYYLYLHPETNKFQFIPWDLDHSFGRIFGDQDEFARMSIHTPWAGHNRFLERVFNVPAFKAMYLARLREFADTVFAPERLEARVDEIAGAVRPSVEAESTEKLASFEQAVGEGAPGAARRRSGLMFVKAFSRLRTQSVRDQLAGKSEGVRPKVAGPGPSADRAAASAGRPKGRTLGAALLAALDSDHDGQVTHGEFTGGFDRWFSTWSRDHGGGLSQDQFRDAIRRDIIPKAPGPGAPGSDDRTPSPATGTGKP